MAWQNVVAMEIELFGGFIIFLATFGDLMNVVKLLGLGLFIKVAIIFNINERRLNKNE